MIPANKLTPAQLAERAKTPKPPRSSQEYHGWRHARLALGLTTFPFKLTAEQLEARAGDGVPKPPVGTREYARWHYARVLMGKDTFSLSTDAVNVYQRQKYRARKTKGMVRV